MRGVTPDKTNLYSDALSNESELFDAIKAASMRMEACAPSRYTVIDELGGEPRVLANVVHDDGVSTYHEDFRGILIHGTPQITDVGQIFDYTTWSGCSTLLYKI